MGAIVSAQGVRYISTLQVSRPHSRANVSLVRDTVLWYKCAKRTHMALCCSHVCAANMHGLGHTGERLQYT